MLSLDTCVCLSDTLTVRYSSSGLRVTSMTVKINDVVKSGRSYGRVR